MTVKLTYRELQRWTVGKLMEKLGEKQGWVYVDSQPMFKIKVLTEKDLSFDSQATKLKAR